MHVLGILPLLLNYPPHAATLGHCSNKLEDGGRTSLVPTVRSWRTGPPSAGHEPHTHGATVSVSAFTKCFKPPLLVVLSTPSPCLTSSSATPYPKKKL